MHDRYRLESRGYDSRWRVVSQGSSSDLECRNAGESDPAAFDLGGGEVARHPEECEESLIRDPVDELIPLICRDGVELLLNLRKTLVTALPLEPPQFESASKMSSDFHLSKAEICLEACLMNLLGAIDPVERDREGPVKALPITLHQGRKASSSCCSDSAKARLTPYAVGS